MYKAILVLVLTTILLVATLYPDLTKADSLQRFGFCVLDFLTTL